MNVEEPSLSEVGDGILAYVQPDGSWGWSNAGLVTGNETSLLVDTLFDLRLTRKMLDQMATVTGESPIGTVVNTHANGDHCFGNQLLAGPDVSIVTSAATSAEMDEVPSDRLRGIVGDDDGLLGEFLHFAFGSFDFDGIRVPPPTHTFSGRHELQVDDRTVELIEVGPAHTDGDILAWVPSDGVLFGGDILFVGGTPIMWAGPIGNWIAACDLIEELRPSVVVPGHGPITDTAGVRDVGDYLRTVQEGVTARHRAGMTPREASLDLDTELNGTKFGNWTDRERLVVTVHQLWKEIEPGYQPPGVVDLFTMVAEDWNSRRPN